VDKVSLSLIYANLNSQEGEPSLLCLIPDRYLPQGDRAAVGRMQAGQADHLIGEHGAAGGHGAPLQDFIQHVGAWAGDKPHAGYGPAMIEGIVQVATIHCDDGARRKGEPLCHHRPHGPLAARLLEIYEDSTLQPWLEVLGLDDTKTRRLNWLLVLHCLIDRLLVAAIGGKLLMCATAEQPPTFDEMFKDLTDLHIPKRIFLARQLGLLSREVADKIIEVNRVRNNFVHIKRKSKGGIWQIGAIPELAKEDSFERCKQKAIEAINALIKHVQR
jgi:hypothetical protein